VERHVSSPDKELCPNGDFVKKYHKTAVSIIIRVKFAVDRLHGGLMDF